jgi:hypothetical protein
MNSHDAIQQELNDLRSSLPFDDKEQPVFTVPEGYFENFAASVWAKIKNQSDRSVADELEHLSPVLAAIPKTTPFSVPGGYFSLLATGLPALVNDEALPDVLKSHTKQMPYTVPSGYFEGLAAQVAAKAAPKAKVVSFTSSFVRYAAAAAIIGIMAIAGVLYLKGNRSTAIDPDTQPHAWVAQKLQNVSNQDLEAFINTADVGFNSKELAKNSRGEVRQLLRDVSTNELNAFLNDVPLETDFSRTN